MIRRGLILILAMASAFAVAEDRPASSTVTAQVVDQKAPAAQTVLTLDDVVRTALANNPAVASAAHSVAAQRARIPQAGSLPDPIVSLGWEGNIKPFSVQTGDPASYRAVTASQIMPFFRKRGLRRDLARKEADASQWDLEGVRRRVSVDYTMTCTRFGRNRDNDEV